MKMYAVGLVSMMLLCGCDERIPPSPSDQAARRVECLIETLRTNHSAKVIDVNYAVRSNLVAVADIELRGRMLNEWKRTLFDVKVDRLKPSDRFCLIRAVADVVRWEIVGAMWEMGASYEERWDVKLEMLAWLDKQCRAMRPNDPAPDCDWSGLFEEEKKWRSYGNLLSYKESVIEYLERNEFEGRDYRIGQARIAAAKARFEKAIGRPVRPNGEIKTFGLRGQEIRKRIRQECDAALREARERLKKRRLQNPTPVGAGAARKSYFM